MARLVVVCGPAGAGKSTYARKLAAETGACLLDSDTVTEPVVRAGMALGGLDPDDRDSSEYRRAFRDPVYECLFAVAAENLPSCEVILVGPFTSEVRDPEWPDRLRERFGVAVEVVYVWADDDERRRRIEARGNPRDASKLADWEGFLAQSRSTRPIFPHRMVTGS